jgi:hypothetical protein
MLTQVALIVLSTLMTTISLVMLWMLRDRLKMAKEEGKVAARLDEHEKRLTGLEEKEENLVGRHEHEDLQKVVKEGLTETREELRGMRKAITDMALIMARATGEPIKSE